MNPPEHLPRTEEELAEWSVYGDHLQSIGDPLGYRIATEAWREGTAVWCLGHVKSLAVRKADEGQLGHALDMLKRPIGRVLEELEIEYTAEYPQHWRRLFAAIPATCTRVIVGLRDPTLIRELIELLPVQVTVLEVKLEQPFDLPTALVMRFVDDRFAEVHVWRRAWSDAGLAAIDAAIARTSSVVVISGGLSPGSHPRHRMGGDAAIVSREQRSAMAIVPWSLHSLQKAYGGIAARRWITRDYEERYIVFRGVAFANAGGTLRHHRDAWMGADELLDGQILVTRDVERRCRELLATTG